MLDSKKRFNKIGRNYDLYRPSYPINLINWIIKTSKIVSSDTVIDVGCGTGISTRLFDNKGFEVIGIDPNEEMLSYARSYKGKIKYKKGDAENTGIKEDRANLIIVAQAFHWFNINSAMNEFQKIIKQGGVMCAFWNVREKTPFSKEFKRLILKFSKDYKKIPSAEKTISAIKKFPGITEIKIKSFPYIQKFNLESLIGRAYSTSYVVYGVNNHQKFKDTLDNIFKKYELGGKVEFKYHSKAICWKFS